MAFILVAAFLPALTLSAQESSYPVYDDFPLPKSLSLCGERMPLENRHIWEMLDREFTISVWSRAQVFLWLKRAGRYFPHLEKKLEEAGMPGDLKYLAVAESSLLTYVRSGKGAVGPWQFMASTAKRNGLRVDRKVDERRNLERSTEAAIKYLRKLKDTFGTWTLAMAAYNCGEKLLRREIAVQKVSDYYRLDLPLETERFIFRIAAIKMILENPECYGYSVAPEHIYMPLKYDTVPVKTDMPLHVTDLAQALNTDYKILKELNPHILGHYLPKGPFTINVPAGLGPEMAGILRQLSLSACCSQNDETCCYVLVKPGDTLIRIAKRTGVSLSNLKKLNGISGSLIKAGQKLRLVP